MKAIKIDGIIDNKPESEEYESEDKYNEISEYHSHLYADLEEHNIKKEEDVFDKTNIQYIDDIDGLNEILENEEDFKKLTHEEYPGLIRIKSREDKSRN